MTTHLSTTSALRIQPKRVQSAIAGEIEPVRRLGKDLSVPTLQQYAYKYGIDQSVNSMTQAQKAQLRYVALMDQSKSAMGDMARTHSNPGKRHADSATAGTATYQSFRKLVYSYLSGNSLGTGVCPVLTELCQSSKLRSLTSNCRKSIIPVWTASEPAREWPRTEIETGEHFE